MKDALLALETATDVCSVALHDGERVIVDCSLRLKQQHARALAPLVEQAVRWLPGGWDALGAVAVSAGPGSYTGLRIGVSTAKGLCAARDLSLVGVPTLEAVAHGARGCLQGGDTLVAVLPSRRGEVYAQRFHADGEILAAVTEPLAVRLAEAPAWLRDAPGVRLVGPGASLLASALPDAIVVSFDATPPASIAVASLGMVRWRAGRVESVAAFEPDYLKPVQVTSPVSSTGS